MSKTLSIQQAATELAQLVAALGRHDEIVLTEDDRPVAKIVWNRPTVKRQPGSCKGMLEILRDDEEHLNDFKDYMP